MLNTGHVIGVIFALGAIMAIGPLLNFLAASKLFKMWVTKLFEEKEFSQKVFTALIVSALVTLLFGIITRNVLFTFIGTLIGAVLGTKIADSNINSRKVDFDLRLKLASGAFLDSVTVCVSSGLSIRSAISEAVSNAPSAVENIWKPLITDSEANIPFAKHLETIADKNRENVMGRISRTLLIAQERGTPILNTLQSLGAEIRSETRRQLLEIAAKKDVAMMIPVVFGILPSITAVALYPAFISLSNM